MLLQYGAAALLCLACYVLHVARTWFRLRHVPSPSLWAGLSYLWLARITYSGRQFWVYRDLHKKLGPLVRIGPNDVVTDDAAVVREISSARSTFSRSTWYLTGRFNPYHDNLFTILESDPHKKARARSLPAYLGTPGLEKCIDDQVATLLAVVGERYMTTSSPSREGQPQQQPPAPLLNIGTISCYFTMDVITRLAFGAEAGYMKDEKDHYEFLAFVRDLWPRLSTSADVPWIRAVLFSNTFLKFFGPKSTDKTGFGALMGVAERYVAERFETDTKRADGDILSALVKRGFNRDECESEALFLLFSGTESTACAIRAILVHAITSPTVYSKLKGEIRRACREGKVSGSVISLEEAKQLPYLQAVVYEGLRMRPPLLGLLPKVVPAPGATFHGHFLPAGTNLCTNTSALLCSPALFGPDAALFRPERFTELDAPGRAKMERNVELAFGYGQWMCAGKTIAFMELNKVIFELFRAFHMQLVDPLTPNDIKSYGVFIETDLRVRISSDDSSGA